MSRCLAFILLFVLPTWCGAKTYPLRWVFVSRSLGQDKDVNDVEGIVRVASEHGINGMVFSGGLDSLSRQSPEYLARLGRVKQICDQRHIEIIPNIFSIGYGGSILGHDHNLAEGIPVEDAPLVVENGQAHLVADPAVRMVNGGFEDHDGNRVKGFAFHDRPGEVSFVDTEVHHSGAASLRFENFGRYEYGHGRVMQEVQVRPHRSYRLSFWVKTDTLKPDGCFRTTVLSVDGRDLAPYEPAVPATSDWRRVVMGFNSLQYDKVRVYAGVWGGKDGRFWLDDWSIEEVALLNVLRRPGTPVTVRGEDANQVYEEGKDFAPIKDDRLNFRFDHDAPTIRVLPSGRIKDGQRLSVSFYHGMAINNGQTSVCMSEPQVYEIMKQEAGLLQKHLGPSRYLLSMDEIRQGGSCQACKQRGLSMAQILGDCITKEANILKEVNPKAEVFIWSDMLDPNHNAHGNYYLVEGDFTGSWKYAPKDLVIVCWYFEKRVDSLGFFSSHGFKTLAGAYYDGDTLDNPRGWLEVLDKTPNALGIMYTTWENKYDLLGPFGDLVASR
jgi:hypothetical protein